MQLQFEKRHIVVTGGTGALGSAVTHFLLEQGARVSIPVYNKSELDDFEHTGHEHLHLAHEVDLTDEAGSTQFFDDAVAAHGELWASVHIAGGFGMGAIGETSTADFMKQIKLNTVTCFNSCKQAVKQMKTTGKGGRIVNIAARPALEPRQGANMSAYTASKAAVAALTQSLAEELAEDEIYLNAIAPSIIDTPPNRQAMPDADFDAWPKPEEIATQILYLISPQNHVTRGGIIPVYGKS